MAKRPPKTLLDLGDDLILAIFKRLGEQDREALAQTCTRFAAIAEGAHVFSCFLHRVDSPASVSRALSYRAEVVHIEGDEAFRLFAQDYRAIDNDNRWPIRTLRLWSAKPWQWSSQANNAESWRGEKLGLLFRGLQNLTLELWCPTEPRLESALFEGMSACTQLAILRSPGGPRYTYLPVLGAGMFSALPQLRSLLGPQ